MPAVTKGDGGGGAFLTQKGEKMSEVKKEIAELESLLQSTSQTSQSTQLLKKRKEMKEVDNALELMKNDYKRRMDECEERRIAFETKQAKMRDQVLKFERFIQENDSKRLRAEAKSKAERKLYMEKLEEIDKKNNEVTKLERAQSDLKKELERRRCFRDYLENVVEASDKSSDMTYEEVPDVLNRYDVLTTANDDLVRVESAQDAEVDDYRKNLHALKTESQNIELTRNSSMQEKQKELEKIRENFKVLEHQQGLTLDKEKSLQQEWGAVEGAIRNIYARCCATMRNMPLFPPPATASVMTVLDFDLDVMWTRIRDLIDIQLEYKPSESSFLGDLNELSVSTAATGFNTAAGVSSTGSALQGGGSIAI
eukprot:GSChrysophyteH2.ASY1.ANO1.617.1 assembled CDS